MVLIGPKSAVDAWSVAKVMQLPVLFTQKAESPAINVDRTAQTLTRHRSKAAGSYGM